jgi:uncharacterized repeat protein (TIGR01451 family)
LTFQPIAVLPGVVGGVVEFDVQLDGTSVSGDVLTNEARLISDQKPGPLISTVSVKIVKADLGVEKSVEVFEPTVGDGFAIPGNDVVYTIKVTNRGDAIDAGSIVVLDPIPLELTFYRGPFDGTTSEPVKFVDGATPSGLTCCSSANIAYSTDNGVTYSYLAPADYDAAITHLRVVPSCVMTAVGASEPSFEVKFRARID